MAVFHILYKGTMTSQESILQKLPMSFFGQIEQDLHKIRLWEDIQETCSGWIAQLIKQLVEKHVFQTKEEEAILWNQIKDAWNHQRVQEICSYRLEEQEGEMHVLSFSNLAWDTQMELFILLQDRYGTCVISRKRTGQIPSCEFVENFSYGIDKQPIEELQTLMQQLLTLPWSNTYFENLSIQKEYEKLLPYLILFVLKAPIFMVHGEYAKPILH